MTQERNLDFDAIIDRRNTDSLKYDFAEKRGMPKNALCLWVADMDFPTSSCILDAVSERVAHGIFGYTESGSGYIEALAGWMQSRYQWEIEPEWVVKTPGVVFALAMAVKAFSKEGDAILIQQPVYYPFAEVIEKNGRKVVSNDLVQREDGSYGIDFDDFEQKLIQENISLFFLCSPHNPVGRVWTKEELIRLGEICIKHQVIVVSDEIHADFVFGNRQHHVFANLREDFADISIVCTSPGKTFNLAGLQVSNIFIPNRTLRKRFTTQIQAAGYSQLNTLGLVACEAAYRYGAVWYEAMLAYVEENIAFLKNYIKKELPKIKVTETEGTYLVWLDFRELGLSEEKQEELIAKHANLWLSKGGTFGRAGIGFERVNVACPRSILEQALCQLKEAMAKLEVQVK
ncbi:MAG: MalY/PatB family protein [Roseburia sp.]